jgi:hypothetical protein
MPINRRDFIGTVAAGISVAGMPKLSAFSAEEGEARPDGDQQKPRPSWLGQMPLVIASNFDDFPLFRRREGGGTTWQEEDFNKESTEEAVRRLRDLGVTMVITHLFKGFGIEAEREYLGNSKRLAELARKHGMKVGLYVGSTIAYETFLLEKPEAEEWFVPDFMGKPVFYDDQTFRKRVYFMHPGYRDYIHRVLEIGIKEFQADLIHFDNTSMQAEPFIFQHPLAVQDFREYLKTKYSAQELKKRLGFSDVTYVVPPKYDRPLTTIDDPLFQEWADFRCHQLNRYYAEMEALLRQLHPEVAVESNPHAEISGRNTIWEEGVYYPKLLAHMDAVWTEEGNPAGVTEDGILINRIRSFKNASILRNTLFVETGSSALQMAESMAFGRQCLGDIGVFLEVQDLPREQRNYIEFFHQNFEHYRDVEDSADVALLYSYATMGFNNDRPQVSFMLYGQTLIQSKVPFAIIFDEHLKDLSKYRVLVLADQECLDDDKIEVIRKFVQNGGGLVATEYTSLYTEWRLRKPDFGLKELFRVAAPPWRGRPVPEEIPNVGLVRNQFGAGRVAYVPEVKAAIEKPPAVRMTSQYWKLPTNWQELIEAIRWAAGGQLPVEVKAPLTVVAEVTEQSQEDKLLVHLLNYDVARVPRVTNIAVDLKLPESKSVNEVSLLTPDGPGIPNLPFTSKNGRVAFTVPQLATYSLTVIRLNGG